MHSEANPKQQDKLQEILQLAIKREIIAQNIYQSLTEMMPGHKSLFEHLVEQEIEHENKLKTIFKDFYPQQELDDYDGEASNLGLKANRVKDPDKLIDFSIGEEREAEEFYLRISKQHFEGANKRMILYLASVERVHREQLKQYRNDF